MKLFFVVAESTNPENPFTKILITSYNHEYRSDVSLFCELSYLYDFGGNLCIFNTDTIDNNPGYDTIHSAVEDSVDPFEWKFVSLDLLGEYIKPSKKD